MRALIDTHEEGKMRRRLEPAERRAEIIQLTYRHISEEGPENLSLRMAARICGMTAPGLMHHFPTLSELLREVLAERARIEQAEIAQLVETSGPELTLERLADHLVDYYASRQTDTLNFDLLEAESFSPSHPLHGSYRRSVITPLPITRRLAERDYVDPEAVLSVLSVVTDGLRIRWLRDPRNADWRGEWESIRDHLFRLFQKKEHGGLRGSLNTGHTGGEEAH